ncbi:TonB-dependent receptor [uncultured Pedobacter sp.]|uniref:TonB-dependent receptor n=1 Tax=uncultured Pedobacter sp. TaxID=246139 RepID=UPI0025DF5522|nr:TonB-dependent receptor plug domain-containing protein [uncultured Pedobacter sp.]
MEKVILFSLVMSFSIASFAQKTNSNTKMIIRGNAATSTEPLFIIDGNKQYIRGTASLSEISPDHIKTINILKDSTAIAKYGTDGIAGVIEVETENTNTGSNLFKNKAIDTAGLNLIGKVSGFKAKPLPDSETPVIRRYLLNRDFDDQAKPLYIVDGKEVDNPQLKGDAIESMEVLKDAGALKQYGDKGKNGVIIITTKTAAPKKN